MAEPNGLKILPAIWDYLWLIIHKQCTRRECARVKERMAFVNSCQMINSHNITTKSQNVSTQKQNKTKICVYEKLSTLICEYVCVRTEIMLRFHQQQTTHKIPTIFNHSGIHIFEVDFPMKKKKIEKWKEEQPHKHSHTHRVRATQTNRHKCLYSNQHKETVCDDKQRQRSNTRWNERKEDSQT